MQMKPNTAPQQGLTTRASAGAADAWKLMGWVGIALLVVGLMDVLLVFYPLSFGQPAWEFGIMDTAVSTLPLLVVGWAAVVGWAIARGLRAIMTAAGVLALILALLVVAGFALYLLSVPVALRLAPPEVVTGVHKSIVRVTVMSLSFGTLFVIGGVAVLRAARTPSR
jgi:hypothetical protein